MTLGHEPLVIPAARPSHDPSRADQRYCLGCGLRCAPDELRLAALVTMAGAVELPTLGTLRSDNGRERPFVRSAAVTAAVVLVLGIGIGATIGPATVGETAAAQRPVIVLAAKPPAAAPAAVAPALSAPLDDSASAADDASTDAPSTTVEAATAPASDSPTTPADSTPPSASDSPATPHHKGATKPSDAPAPAADTAPPGSTALAGVVLATNATGEGFSLVDRSGALLAIHASGCAVVPGDSLHLRARTLANGTWAADRIRRVGDALTTARVTGVVSWIDPASGRYALAARGTTLLVTVAPTPAAAPSAAAAGPTLGARLRVQVQLQPQDGKTPASLLERARTALAPQNPTAGAPIPPLELDGAIVTVDQQARTVVLALDALTPPTATVTLSAPPALDLARLLPAQRVAATATLAPDGSYVLSGTSADDDAATADDASTLQGDQAAAGQSGSSDTAQTVPSACTDLSAGVRRAKQSAPAAATAPAAPPARSPPGP